MRRARATMPRLAPRRRATCAARVLSHVDRPRCIITGAAWHSARRRFTSQALVRPPETSRSPDWLREGVEPTHGPTLSDEGNREGSSTAERKVGATTAPGPAARQGSARQCPESEHRPQPAADGVILSRLSCASLQPRQVLAQGCPRPKHRPCRGLRHRIAARRFAAAMFVPAPRDAADPEPEGAQQPAKGTFPGRSCPAGWPCGRRARHGPLVPKRICSATAGTDPCAAGAQCPPRPGDLS